MTDLREFGEATLALPPATAKAEWSAMWPLPLVALLGVAGTSIFSFSSGVLLLGMTKELGWGRAQYFSGFTLQMLVSVALAPVLGWIVGRIGPRRMALAGIVPFALAFAALGLADGNIWQWRMLCVIQSVAAICISPTVWITAVVGRFNISRGLAIATAFAGLGVASTLWPLLAAFYVGHFGWRLSFGALSFSWAALTLPLTWLFFFGPRDRPVRAAEVALRAGAQTVRFSAKAAFLSRPFICLVLAGSMFACMVFGINLHIVPILHGAGFGLAAAARLASLAGLLTLAGRIGTGWILDHVEARKVGLVIFTLPAAGCALLLEAKGSFALSMAAVILFGLASGAETDLTTYIASRHFPPKLFASAYATMLAIFGGIASFGPLIAGAMFDATGAYDRYLKLVIPVVLLGAVLIWFIPGENKHDRAV